MSEFTAIQASFPPFFTLVERRLNALSTLKKDIKKQERIAFISSVAFFVFIFMVDKSIFHFLFRSSLDTLVGLAAYGTAVLAFAARFMIMPYFKVNKLNKTLDFTRDSSKRLYETLNALSENENLDAISKQTAQEYSADLTLALGIKK